MKRFMVACAAGAVMLALVGPAGAAQKKESAKKETAMAEKKNAPAPHPAAVIRGNPGFHYGSHYNMYTMHIKQPEAK